MNRENLAWAAGLFDGEGCFFLGGRKRGGRVETWIETRITQAHPEVLHRFREALGMGRVYGPYGRSKSNHRPQWQYVIYGLQGTQATIAMLWPWLGTVKRGQASSVLLRLREANTLRQAARGARLQGSLAVRATPPASPITIVMTT